MQGEVKYLSTQGKCVCEKHIRSGGAYLEAEVKNSHQTVSSRPIVDGLETIMTPLDNWLIIPASASEFNEIACEVCEAE